ncbi:cytochrome b/b6 domain-containing protein, partial [Microbacterium sp. CnD16-F]|nr:cytochrome b/b6 domain-containing protein [Microbacterium sp. CnD16-F]
MATYARSVRRGLPRVSGGDPWPPAGSAPVADAAAAPVADAAAAQLADAGAASVPDEVAPPTDSATTASAESATRASGSTTTEDAVASHHASAPATATRRGLPRTPGGEPWPPASTGPATAEGAAQAERRPDA